MELNGARPFLAYAGDTNLIGENINRPTIKKSTQPLPGASMEVCVEIQSDSKLLSGFLWPIIFKP
jgi:hypothetical protein